MTGPSVGCGVCQCSLGDGECTHWDGGYEDEPYVLQPTLDDYSDNLIECGPAGLGAFLPRHIADPPACSVYSGYTQTIQHNTPQFLFFEQEHFDTDSMHDKQEDNTRITINTPGIYLINANIRWSKNPNGDRAIVIVKNIIDYLAVDALHAGGADLYLSQSVSCIEYLKAGDFLDVLVRQDSGINLPVTARRWSPVFSAEYLRPPP